MALRVYLAVLASLALYAAYAVWLRVRPDGSVPLAALALSSLWVTVFYGPTTMPNVAIALAGVFATGTLLCAARGIGPRWLPWAGGAAVGVATLVRPGDVVPLLGALGVAVLVHPAGALGPSASWPHWQQGPSPARCRGSWRRSCAMTGDPGPGLPRPQHPGDG